MVFRRVDGWEWYIFFPNDNQCVVLELKKGGRRSLSCFCWSRQYHSRIFLNNRRNFYQGYRWKPPSPVYLLDNHADLDDNLLDKIYVDRSVPPASPKETPQKRCRTNCKVAGTGKYPLESSSLLRDFHGLEGRSIDVELFRRIWGIPGDGGVHTKLFIDVPWG